MPIPFGWRAPAKRKPTPGVAAGLDMTLRTSAGIPPQPKRRLDGKRVLPPRPRVDACLHAGGDPESPAQKQLRRTVTGHALESLREKEMNGVRFTWRTTRQVILTCSFVVSIPRTLVRRFTNRWPCRLPFLPWRKSCPTSMVS